MQSFLQKFQGDVKKFSHDVHQLSQKWHCNIDRKYPIKTSTTKPANNTVVCKTPPNVDLSQKAYMPSVLDQQTLGSCAENAMANNLNFLLGKENLPQWLASRLAMYYNTRVLIENSPANDDTGVTLEDLCQAVNKYHVFPEKLWPYNIANFADTPPDVDQKQENTMFSAHAVPQNLNAIRSCLSAGFPILIGIQVYESFESQAVAESGVVPIPGDSEQCLGGHALLLVGYSDDKQGFWVQNSWNTSWGSGGYCMFPYDYLLNPDLASDFWCVQLFK